jgi:hypothetical protein
MPTITPAHRAAEARFRELVLAAELDPPDRVTYEPDSLTFFWEGPKVAVIVDLDDPGRTRARSRSGRCGPPLPSR